MRKSKAWGSDIGLSVLIVALVAGCVSTNSSTNFSAHPQLQEKVGSIKTVAIMPPSIEVRQIPFSGDGGWLLMDEETAAAKQTVATAVERELGRHAGVVFKPFSSPSATSAVNYAAGPEVQRLATLANADALLFISGDQLGYSRGAKAASVLIMLPIWALAGLRMFPPRQVRT